MAYNTTRHRSMSDQNLFSPIYGVSRAYWKGALVSSSNQVMTNCYSHVKNCDDAVNPGPPWRRGSGLRIEDVWNDSLMGPSSLYVYQDNPGGWRKEYEGIFPCLAGLSTLYNGWGNSGSLDASDFDEVFEDSLSYGPTGWAKAAPGRPTADLGQFLAEIREVPKMLHDTAHIFKQSWDAYKGGRKSMSKHAANTWLGYNFGWVPFVNDLRKFWKTAENIDDTLNQIIRNNDKFQRRERSIFTATDTLSDSGWELGTWHVPVFSAYEYSGTPWYRRRAVITRYRHFWFSGSFRYWIPDLETMGGRRRTMRKLFGANVTPELVWEITPFSWLADWIGNLGDNFKNLDTGWADNLVAKYAYVMGTQYIEGNFTTQFNWAPSVPFPRECSNTIRVTLKDRRPASPFGFALTSEGFTARQWSLISACGLQRSRYTL